MSTQPSYEELKVRVAELEKQHETERSYVVNLEKLVTARTEELHQTLKDLERSYDIALQALGDALDLKCAETEGHSKRVTVYTIAMARAMSLPGEKIRVVARGAFLHDIGKMAIPDSILRKPAALTQDETTIVQEHCYRGYQMLRTIPFLTEAAEIVYAHQEKWDGTGYPRGLKGEEIPVGARIVAVAETFDAITSDQPYRTARPFAAACEEISSGSGRQFDPGVVKVFLAIPESVWHDLRKEIDQQIFRYQAKQEGNRS